MKRLPLLSLFLLPACGVPLDVEGGDWKESEAYTKPKDKIWSACVKLLEERGWKFKVKEALTGRILTEPRIHLDPRWRFGDRQKVEIEVREVVEKTEKKHKLRVRVLRDVNDNSRDPMSEKEAVWVDAGGNDGLRDQLLYLLHMRIKGLGLDD